MFPKKAGKRHTQYTNLSLWAGATASSLSGTTRACPPSDVHVLHYGSRSSKAFARYCTKKGSGGVFRLREHMQRLSEFREDLSDGSQVEDEISGGLKSNWEERSGRISVHPAKFFSAA